MSRKVQIGSVVYFRINPVVQQIRLLQVAKSYCRTWRVVVLVSTKSVHVACFTGSRQSQSSVSEMMFMVLNAIDPIWFDSAFTCYKGASSNGNKNHEYLMGLAAT